MAKDSQDSNKENTDQEKPTFEEAAARLDEIVKTLERGDAPLNEALAMFEQGAGLIKLCGQMLDEAEQLVVRLEKGADGEPEESNFDGMD